MLKDGSWLTVGANIVSKYGDIGAPWKHAASAHCKLTIACGTCCLPRVKGHAACCTMAHDLHYECSVVQTRALQSAGALITCRLSSFGGARWQRAACRQSLYCDVHECSAYECTLCSLDARSSSALQQLKECTTAARGAQAEEHVYRSAAGLAQHGSITAAGWQPTGGVAAG